MRSSLTRALVLAAVAASSVVLAYTVRPGPQKGVFFRDRWDRTWFLRPSAVAVGKSIAAEARERLGKPLTFDVSEFDATYAPSEYRDGKLLADPDAEAASGDVALFLGVEDETVHLTVLYKGPDEFIVRDAVMLIAFSPPSRDTALPPRPAHLVFKGLIFPEPTLRTGDKVAYGIALADVVERLGLPPGEHQLIAAYFNDFQNVRVVSDPWGIRVKKPPEPGDLDDAE